MINNDPLPELITRPPSDSVAVSARTCSIKATPPGGAQARFCPPPSSAPAKKATSCVRVGAETIAGSRQSRPSGGGTRQQRHASTQTHSKPDAFCFESTAHADFRLPPIWAEGAKQGRQPPRHAVGKRHRRQGIAAFTALLRVKSPALLNLASYGSEIGRRILPAGEEHLKKKFSKHNAPLFHGPGFRLLAAIWPLSTRALRG